MSDSLLYPLPVGARDISSRTLATVTECEWDGGAIRLRLKAEATSAQFLLQGLVGKKAVVHVYGVASLGDSVVVDFRLEDIVLEEEGQ